MTILYFILSTIQKLLNLSSILRKVNFCIYHLLNSEQQSKLTTDAIVSILHFCLLTIRLVRFHAELVSISCWVFCFTNFSCSFPLHCIIKTFGKTNCYNMLCFVFLKTAFYVRTLFHHRCADKLPWVSWAAYLTFTPHRGLTEGAFATHLLVVVAAVLKYESR